MIQFTFLLVKKYRIFAEALIDSRKRNLADRRQGDMVKIILAPPMCDGARIILKLRYLEGVDIRACSGCIYFARMWARWTLTCPGAVKPARHLLLQASAVAAAEFRFVFILY
jgi:hypothetical protein